MGVRLEQPQEIVNRVKYGKDACRWHDTKLGAADYNLVARGPNDLFTFCMCAGGYIIPSVSEAGYFCTNGMSLSGRDSPFANSGLVVTVPVSAFPGTDVLAGVRLQQELRTQGLRAGPGQGRGEYFCPIQNAGDYPGPSAHREGAGVQLSPRPGAGPHRGIGAADHRRAP